MHFFYFSYCLIILCGMSFAFLGTAWKPPPAPGFETALTSCVMAFLVAYVWFPFLPARGPWENPQVMAGLPPFQGGVFTAAIEEIIRRGAVSGGCFPSAHVAGAWGVVFGLARYHPRVAWAVSFFAAGMSFACVYTRYHHAVDVPAGFLAGAIGAWIAWKITPAPNRG